MASTAQAMARKTKATEIAVLEACSRMPHLFRLSADGHRIALVAPGEDPGAESPATIKARAEADRLAARATEREASRQAQDEADTPVNALRAALEDCGLCRTEARAFAGMLAKNYGCEPSLQAARLAAQSKAASPKAYVVALLKQRISGTSAAGFPRRVPAYARPSGVRETVRIGWSAERTEPRMALYRLPEGRIKKVPPAPGEQVPTYEEDAGYEVMP